MVFLQVSVRRASELPRSDWGCFGGKSDPYVVVAIGQDRQKSSCIANEMNPEWRPAEVFDFQVEDLRTTVLSLTVYDNDPFISDELLGSAAIPLAKYEQQVAKAMVVESKLLDVPEKYAKQNRSSTIEFGVSLREKDDGPKTLYVWENESWGPIAGWYPTNNANRRHYSSYNGERTADKFAEVAPTVPDHLTGDSWEFSKGSGDDQGWVYAATWAGPFSAKRTRINLVRRRLWEKRCVPIDDTV